MSVQSMAWKSPLGVQDVAPSTAGSTSGSTSLSGSKERSQEFTKNTPESILQTWLSFALWLRFSFAFWLRFSFTIIVVWLSLRLCLCNTELVIQPNSDSHHFDVFTTQMVGKRTEN